MALLVKSLFFGCCAAVLAASLITASTIPPSTEMTTTEKTTIANGNTKARGNGIENAATTTASTTTDAAVASENDSNTTTTASNTTTTAAAENSTTASVTATSGAAENSTTIAPTTTTTAYVPQPPFYCHECNSENALPGMWSNPACSRDGYVAQWYTPSYCDTFCFTGVGLYPAGTVFRGCADALYLPDQVLQDGCFDDVANNRHICLCSGDLCNIHDLTDVSQDYVYHYLTMQAAQSANSV